MKVFVAGGTGFVGSYLIPALLKAGHSVRILVHKRTGPILPGVETFSAELSDLDSLSKGMAGCDAIVNLIGIIREFHSKGVTFERMHIQATEALVAAAVRCGISRFIQMSALGTRLNAVSAYHRTKYAGEEIVRGSSLSWTIMRPSLIYGRGDAFVTMLASQLRILPVIPLIGDGNYMLQPINVSDVARCFASAVELNSTISGCYELCGPKPMTYRELLDTIAGAIGKRPPFKIELPLSLMQSIIPVLQHIPQFPITTDQLQMLLEGSICKGCLWQNIFGVEPIPFDEGIRLYL